MGTKRECLAVSTALLVAIGSQAHAQTLQNVTLAWDANVEPDLAGYKMYYGPGPRK